MLIVKAGQLVDGTGAPPVRNVALAIEAGRIKSIVPAAAIAEAEREVVDLSNATVLPGLIDAHVHLMFEPGADHEAVRQVLAGDSPDIALLRAARNAQLALSAGVTTVRDCGGRGLTTLLLRDAIARGLLVGPRVIASGQPITTTRGHLHYLGLEADSEAEVIKAGRQMAKAGVDFLKVCVTGGNMTAGSNAYLPQYGASTLNALVADAHRLGLRVAGHCHGTPGVRLGVEAGLDTIEHATFIGSDGTTEFDPLLAEQMVANGLYASFTFTAAQRRLLPEGGARDAEYGRALERLQENVAVFRTLLASGVKAMVCSDAGVKLTRFEEFAQSLEVMVLGCRATNMEAIVAATRTPAQALGLAHDLGTLEVGKVADLVAIEGDPLADITAMKRVRAVMRAGRVLVWQGRMVLRKPTGAET